MGCGMVYLNYLDQKGVFGDGAVKVLDVGAQNLLNAATEDLQRFLGKYGKGLTPAKLDAIAQDLSDRSFVRPGERVTYLYELLEHTRLDYLALDIFTAGETLIFDLNYQGLPATYHGAFDVVLNFGTTEHVFNQYNSFKVIHEAAKVGGYIFHQVPSTGYVDHGYFMYSPRTFTELAKANEYDVVDIWFTGPQGFANVLDVVTYHDAVRDPTKPGNDVAGWTQVGVPNAVVNVLLRKTSDSPFRLSVDTTTSAGEVSSDIAAAYERGADGSPDPVQGRPPDPMIGPSTRPPIITRESRSFRMKQWIRRKTAHRIKRGITHVLTRCLDSPPPDLREPLQASLMKMLEARTPTTEVLIKRIIAGALENPGYESRIRMQTAIAALMEQPVYDARVILERNLAGLFQDVPADTRIELQQGIAKIMELPTEEATASLQRTLEGLLGSPSAGVQQELANRTIDALAQPEPQHRPVLQKMLSEIIADVGPEVRASLQHTIVNLLQDQSPQDRELLQHTIAALLEDPGQGPLIILQRALGSWLKDPTYEARIALQSAVAALIENPTHEARVVLQRSFAALMNNPTNEARTGFQHAMSNILLNPSPETKIRLEKIIGTVLASPSSQGRESFQSSIAALLEHPRREARVILQQAVAALMVDPSQETRIVLQQAIAALLKDPPHDARVALQQSIAVLLGDPPQESRIALQQTLAALLKDPPQEERMAFQKAIAGLLENPPQEARVLLQNAIAALLSSPSHEARVILQQAVAALLVDPTHDARVILQGAIASLLQDPTHDARVILQEAIASLLQDPTHEARTILQEAIAFLLQDPTHDARVILQGAIASLLQDPTHDTRTILQGAIASLLQDPTHDARTILQGAIASLLQDLTHEARLKLHQTLLGLLSGLPADTRTDLQLAFANLLGSSPPESRGRLRESVCEILDIPTFPQCVTENGPIPPPPAYSEQRAAAVYGEAFRRCFEYISGTGIRGAVLEFGTFYGWTACLIADLMGRFHHEGDLMLFDSFEGLPGLTSHVDRESYEVKENQVWRECELTVPEGHEKRLAESLSAIIPSSQIKIAKGDFAETLDSCLQETKAALVHIDCDLYSSSKFVLDKLLERHTFLDGCVLLFDDFNTNRANPSMGERRALVEAFSSQDRYIYSEWFTYGWHGKAFIVHDQVSFLK